MELVLSGWALAAALMVAMWLYQWKAVNASHVDVAWAYGVGLLALLYTFHLQAFTDAQLLVLACALVWSLRLGTFLWLRMRGKPEDSRYKDLRTRWSQTKFFVFYQFQALAIVFFSVPILISLQYVSDLALESLNCVLGASIAAISLWGEGIADRQLSRFKKNPSHGGKTCRAGLWKYSRHPNYFFEWVFWFAFVAFGWGSQQWILTLLGPVVMLILLFGVTGIPPSEARALESRGEDYRDYQSKTSAFIPWFPKS
jgi:steroid 5-alpha reductase family enzyme